MSIEDKKDVSNLSHKKNSNKQATEKMAQEAYAKPPGKSNTGFVVEPDGTRVREYSSGGKLMVKPDGTRVKPPSLRTGCLQDHNCRTRVITSWRSKACWFGWSSN